MFNIYADTPFRYIAAHTCRQFEAEIPKTHFYLEKDPELEFTLNGKTDTLGLVDGDIVEMRPKRSVTEVIELEEK